MSTNSVLLYNENPSWHRSSNTPQHVLVVIGSGQSCLAFLLFPKPKSATQLFLTIHVVYARTGRCKLPLAPHHGSCYRRQVVSGRPKVGCWSKDRETGLVTNRRAGTTSLSLSPGLEQPTHRYWILSIT
ncbi:hypothetical protein FJTKL_01049 [Diaporthe vaccinii]|uniref:Uncharacterized protein n=1 Tax=Diaporthe vaccinii TaxID=105482 RepID=A0ABR4E1I8_9PEZI